MKTAAVPQLLLIVAAQLVALLLVYLLEAEMPTVPEAKLALQGFIASLVGRLLRLPYWLAPINFLLPLTVMFIASQFIPL